MKHSYWTFEDVEKQTVHYRGKVLEYDGSRIVSVRSCTKVRKNRIKALEDAKALIKSLRKENGNNRKF